MTTTASISTFFSIGTFIVEAAKAESTLTGFEIRTFLWEKFPFTPEAMEAFVTAYEATGIATRVIYDTNRIAEREERSTTPDENREMMNVAVLQDAAWSLFKTVFLNTVTPEFKKFAERKVDAEEWAVIKAFRALERERKQ